MPDVSEFFTLSAPLGELFLRGTITFLALTVLLRIVGQRESGGLGITDLLVVLLVADAASAGLTGGATSIADGLVLVVTILVWSVALDAVAYRWPWVNRVIKGRPHALIKDGELNRHAMRRELMNEEEVASQLRLHGITDRGAVYLAYIEPNGKISIIPRGDEKLEEEPDSPMP